MTVPAAMQAVLASGRIPGTFGKVVHAALSGALLGILSEPQLRELDEHYYRFDSVYRSEGWNERGLDPWERDAVGRSFRPRSKIAVIACGGGREVLGLLQMGFDAVGYESHPDLCGYAQAFTAAHGYPGRVMPMDRDHFPPDVSCHGILIGWEAYSLIAGSRRRVSFLRAAGAAAASDGAVILSCFARRAHGRDLRLTWRLARALRRALRRASVELGDTLAPNRVHVFTQAHLDQEIGQAGWVLESYRVYAPADEVTDCVCAVARVAG